MAAPCPTAVGARSDEPQGSIFSPLMPLTCLDLLGLRKECLFSGLSGHESACRDFGLVLHLMSSPAPNMKRHQRPGQFPVCRSSKKFGPQTVHVSRVQCRRRPPSLERDWTTFRSRHRSDVLMVGDSWSLPRRMPPNFE